MGRVVVDVMLKAEISDPQGQAILAALGRLGHSRVDRVRQGKHFELDVADPVDSAMIESISATLLSNPVIEDFTVRLATDG